MTVELPAEGAAGASSGVGRGPDDRAVGGWSPAALRRTVLRRTVLRRTALHPTVVHPAVVRRTVLRRTVLRRTVLHRTVLRRTVLRRTAEQMAVWLTASSRGALARGVPGLALFVAACALCAALLTEPAAADLFRVAAVGLSTLLAAVAWTTLMWVLDTWPNLGHWLRWHRRSAPPGNPDEESSPRPGSSLLLVHWLDSHWDHEADVPAWPGVVTPGLTLGGVAGLLCLVWVRPGLWQVVLALIVAGVLYPWGSRNWDRRVVALTRRARPHAAHFALRVRPTDRLRLQWRALAAHERAIILLLVLLNLVTAAVLLRSDTTLFVVVAGLEFILLNRLFGARGIPGAEVMAGGDDDCAAATTGAHVAALAPLDLSPPEVSVSRAGSEPLPPEEEVVLRHVPVVALSAPVAGPGRTPGAEATGGAETGGVEATGGAESPLEPEGATAGRRSDEGGGLLERVRPALGVVAAVVAVAWIAYARPGTLLIPAAVTLGFAIPLTANTDRDQTIRMTLAIAVAATGIDYISWRFGVTNWQGWWISVPLLSAETFGALHVLGFQVTRWPKAPFTLQHSENPEDNPIFVLVPTLNEGPEVLRPTLEACLVARERYLSAHPGASVQIIVCNDGRAAGADGWKDTDALARTLGVAYLTRRTSQGAKAGNIENARRVFSIHGNALMAVFDADQAPRPEFLLKTIPPFEDSRLGWVQTGQYYANLGNPVSRWADDQQSLFYNVLCPGKAAQDAAFICGTNVVIRAAALDEIGGLPQDSVTEDFAASIALHPRWRSVYLTEVLAVGLGPLDLPSYLRQQSRWALGTLGVLRKSWRDIFLPRKGGLAALQRVQYFLACTHYLSGVRDLIYMVSPVVFVLTGIPAVRSASIEQYLWHFLPYALLSVVALWYSSRGVTGLRGIVVGFGSFPALLGSVMAVLLRRRVQFAVTAKRHRTARSLNYLAVYVVAALVCLGSLIWATQVTGQQRTSLFVSIMWLGYSLLMLGSFLWLAVRDLLFQGALRRDNAPERVVAKVAYPSKLLHRPSGLRPAGNLLLAAAIASPILLGSQLGSIGIFPERQVLPFVVTAESPIPPLTGVSLPTRLLSSLVTVLQHDLGAKFGIVGRTEDISDRFRTAWADGLAARGVRPWITLQFGEFGPHHRPPLDASLPAIINGVDDSAITRWAQEIRDFGKPVYLTILLQVDKNWSVSSAVANGGIPEDVPKAWAHVQSIFDAVGATNVAWVWAPADPLHDQRFAPPPSTIDVVLQSFINYPNTAWGDPMTVLTQLTKRYPGKPLIVEASVAGGSRHKAVWLREFGRAVSKVHQVVAVLYHEAGPNLNPTAAQVRQWSLQSDEASLAAWRQVMTDLSARR